MKLSETGDRKRRERKEREEERSVNPSVHRSSNSSRSRWQPVVGHVSDSSLVAVKLFDASCGHHVMHGHSVINASTHDVSALWMERHGVHVTLQNRGEQ